MPEEKIGTKVELDITKYLGDLAKLGTAWEKYLDILEETYPTSEKVNKALKVTTDRIKELRLSTEKLSEEAKKELAVLKRRAAGLKDLVDSYKKLAAAEKAGAAETSRATKETEQTTQRTTDAIAAAHIRQQKAAEATARAQEQAAKKAEQAQKRQKRAAEAAARAQERQTGAVRRNLKQMLLWGIGAASAYRMFMQIRRALQETFGELYENTEEYKALTAATEQFKISLLSILGTESDVLTLLDRTAAGLSKMADGFNQSVAAIRGFLAFQEEFTRAEGQEDWIDAIEEVLGPSGALVVALKAIRGTTAGLRDQEGVTRAAAQAWEVYNESIDSYNKQVEKAADSTEEMKSAIGDLISLSQKWTDALSTHAEKQQEITNQYTTNVQVIQAQYYQKLFKADRKYNKAVDKINADALKSREKAYANYAKQLAAAQRQARLAEQQNAARHALEMKFARRRYNLSRLQSERMYQYQRGMLVAYGDVLAIEDLDARYELERQAQEENFKLQMEQAEAMFRLQQRIQRETNREQMAMLRQALNEQLRAVEENRQERLAEAEAARAEEKAEAATWTGEQIADEYTRQQKLLKQNDEYLENMRKKTAEGLVKIAQEHELSEEQIAQIAREVFGADGEIVHQVREGLKAQELLASQFEAIWTRAAQNVRLSLAQVAAALAAVRAPRGGTPGGRGWGVPGRGYQYGGQDIVTSPTLFLAGEGNQPERVTVQPLSPIGGGALTLGWRGGPIPLQGQGLEGADLSGLGDAITQGIMAEVRGSILSYRGQRGS